MEMSKAGSKTTDHVTNRLISFPPNTNTSVPIFRKYLGNNLTWYEIEFYFIILQEVKE